MKRFTATAILGIMLILPARSAIAAPVDLSIGGTAWYIWWKPAWADAKSAMRVISPAPAAIIMAEDAADFKTGSNAMAGPVISIGFLDRWSIQSVLTMGRITYRSKGISRDLQMTFAPWDYSPSIKSYNRDVLKWDSDTSIGCAVHRMVKIFAGFKHQGYRYDERMKDLLITANPAWFTRELTDDVRSYGGGLGLGLTFPLATDFYLMMSVSGVVLWSLETIMIRQNKTYIIDPFSGFVLLSMFPRRGRYLSYGGTASLSFAYSIEKINTTLSLGGRYQLLYNSQKYSRNNPLYNEVASNVIDGQYDHFFGITFSAIYTFHIGK